jgi:urease accessory protein
VVNEKTATKGFAAVLFPCQIGEWGGRVSRGAVGARLVMLWLVPLTFVTVMAFGCFLGVMGVPVPFVEVGIALSVIVLGAIVAFGLEVSVAVATGVLGLFAILHGHAHGSEMPLDASGFEYGIGFMMATALLQAVGIGVGLLIGISSKTLGNNVYRVAGGLASVAGVALLLGYL